MEFENQTVCISGASGFIGTHLTKKLTDLKANVVPIKRELFNSPDDLQDFIFEHSPNYIFHLASYGNHANQNNIDEVISSNYFKTYLLMRQSYQTPLAAFINFSTTSVMLPRQTFYSATKLGAEMLGVVFRQQYECPVVNVRPASIYGEGEADFRFIPTVIKHLKNGKKMPLVEEATHSWTYVADLVDAVLHIAKNAMTITDPISISSGRSYTNKDVVLALERISGKKLNYEKVNQMRSYDNNDWLIPDTDLQSIGFATSYSLEEGLRRTYEQYKTK